MWSGQSIVETTSADTNASDEWWKSDSVNELGYGRGTDGGW